MALMIPKWGWNYCYDNLGTAAPTTNFGTSFTLGASNAKGTTAAINSGSTLSDDCYYISISIGVANDDNSVCNNLVDIMYDPAGGTSWSVLIPDLTCGYAHLPNTAAGQTTAPIKYQFPIRIPAGASLGVRGQTSRATTETGCCAVWIWGSPSRMDTFWYGNKIEVLGLDSANSRGTAITPGASNTWGTAVSFTATKPYGAMILGVPSYASTNDGTRGYQFRFQATSGATVPWPGTTNIVRSYDTLERGCCEGMFGPRYVDMVGNETIYVSANCHTTSPSTQYVTIYGVY